MSLTAPERETIIGTSDADDHWWIWTAQRRVITKLKKNPAAVLVDEGSHGSSVWAEFRIPGNLVSFRSGTRKRAMTNEQKVAAVERLRKARRAA
jgi:hypothetical protein